MEADLTKLRERILSEVENFGILSYDKEFAFRPGIDPVPVSGKVLDPSDLVALFVNRESSAQFLESQK